MIKNKKDCPEEKAFEAFSSSSSSVAVSEGSLGTSVETGADAKNKMEEEEEGQAIAKSETKVVHSLKLLVYAVLILSTIGVALAVYYFLSNSEQTEFEGQFVDDAKKVLEALGSNLDLTLGSVDALVVSMVSYARDTNQSWPYVTIPDFAVRTSKIRVSSRPVKKTMPYHT